ncbi:MAG: translation initiation factor [Alphaproteobacteria bacterium]|nr:translation initiation factor [Alphaproteobacteria bacterium]
MKKTNLQDLQFVYSTNKNIIIESNTIVEQTLDPQNQALKIRLDTKLKAGKIQTVISGFVGNVADAEELTKSLKVHCGSGGSFKDGLICIQGDHREKSKQFLLKQHYKKTKII